MPKANVCFIFAFSYILTVLTLGPTLAAISVDQSILASDVDPGQHIKHEIIMKSSNKSNSMDFLAALVGFGQTPEGGNLEIDAENDTSSYSARSFFTITPTSFHLEPGDSQKLILEGDIPSDVGEGGRFAMVNIHSVPSSNQTGSSVGLSIGLNVDILLMIKATQKIETGEITNVELSNPISSKQQNVSVTFKNTGNYYYKAQAKADLKDKDGNVLAKVSTPLSFSSIIPPNSRLFDFALIPDNELKPGTYYISTTVNKEDGETLATNETSFELPVRIPT
jgi:P pilus assembly chaperone PapD